MDEASKTLPILVRTGLIHKLTGRGLDIGCGHDPIKVPGATVDPWDKILGHGDAFTLPGVENETYDFIFSSHCLEDSDDVPAAIQRWSQVLKRGGYMVITVPSYFLYEHLQWPSKGNGAHRASFDLFNYSEDIDHPHYELSDMVRIGFGYGLMLIDASIQCDGYDFTHIYNKSFDQTRHGALAQCMFVFIKP
jgi:SAM-dependent methyltransferase